MGFLPDTQNYRLRKRWECRERFPRHRGLAIPTCITDHGTYVTHVPWCMPESLTTGFLWSRCRGKRSRHSRHMRNPQFCVSGKRPMVVRRHDPIIVDVNAAVPLAQKHVMTSCHFNYCDSVLSLDSWTCRIIPADLCGGWCVALWWRHNGRDSVSNHQPHDCLLNRLFRRRSKKTSKLRVTGLCVGNSPGTGEFSAQRASNAENASIWWRHHGKS